MHFTLKWVLCTLYLNKAGFFFSLFFGKAVCKKKHQGHYRPVLLQFGRRVYSEDRRRLRGGVPLSGDWLTITKPLDTDVQTKYADTSIYRSSAHQYFLIL